MTEANCPLSDIVSMPETTSGLHQFEESDQLVLLNAFDVMHKNSNTTRIFLPVGTNVFFRSPLHISGRQKRGYLYMLPQNLGTIIPNIHRAFYMARI